LKGNEIRALLRPVAAPACLRAVPKGPYQHHVVAVERIFLCPPGRTEPVVVQPGEFTKAEGVLNIIQLKTNTTTCDQIVLHHPWRFYVAEASDPSAADSGVYQVPVWRFCGKALLVPYLNELMDDISAA
jgi:hypothetical protein